MDPATIERMKAALAAPDQTTAPPPDANAAAPPSSLATQAGEGDAQKAGMEPDAGAVGATQTGENTVSTGDVGNAALGAGRDAVQGAWETAWHALAPVARFADEHGLNVLGAPSALHETQPELPAVPRADEEKGGAGLVNTSRDVGRFILGFVGAGALLKGLGAAEGIATSVAAGGLGDFVVTGAHDQRIVDFLSEYPPLKGPFLEALADAGKDGSESGFWERKLEAAGEGVLTGAAMEGVIKVAGILRKVIVAQKAGDVEGARKIVEDAQPELQQAYEGLQAYHGSGADFEKFDSNFAYSGEGSQAFGHGHYVAENRGVAEHYQSVAARNPSADADELIMDLTDRQAQHWPASQIGDALSLQLSENPKYAKLKAAVEADPEIKDMMVSAIKSDNSSEWMARSQAKFNALPRSEGNLYEVNVKASKDQLMDWDKPLSEQPEAVQAKLLPLVEQHQPLFVTDGKLNDVETGEGLYHELAGKLGSEEAASKALNEAGIPGHQFLDNNSRSAARSAPRDIAELKETIPGFDKQIADVRAEIDANKNNKGMLPAFFESREARIKDLEEQKQVRVDRLAKLEAGEDLTHNYVIYHDDGLEITHKNGEPVTMKTDGANFEHSNGNSPLPLSDTAKAEIAEATKDGKSAKLEDLSPETQTEIKDFLGKNPELLPTPKFGELEKYEPTFKLDDTNRAQFEEALEKTLTVPYATLRAEAPGTALEDVLGNYFNYSKYTGPDQAKVLLSDLAAAIQPKIDAAGGGAVRTWKQANAELSDWLGVNSSLLTGTLQQIAGATNLDSIMTATRVLINSQTNDLLKLATLVRSGAATEADKLRLLNTKAVLTDVVGLAKNAQRNIARAQSSMRQAVGEAVPEAEQAALRRELDDETWKFVSNVLGMTDGSPKAVIKIATEPSFWEKAFGVAHEFWINAALGHLATQTVNLLSNTRNTFMYPFYRIVGGALTMDSQSVKLGMAQYMALKNHVFDSLEMARRALMTNAPVLDSKMQQLEGQRVGINADTFGLNGNPFGTAITWLGNTLGMPTRFLTSSDEFFGQLNYRASVEARARVEAASKGLSYEKNVEMIVGGEKQMTSEADQYVQQQLDAAFGGENRSGSGYGADGSLLNPAAMADSRKSKFTQPLKTAVWLGDKSIAEGLEQMAQHIPVVQHFLFPFIKVPANIFRATIDESPVAPIRAQFLKDIKAGGEARADAMGKWTAGGLFTTGMAMLAGEGYITGGGPSDPDRQRQWRADGNIPYSIRVPGMGENGKDAFIPYNRLDPIAGIMGIVADITYISGHLDKNTQNDLAGTVALSLAANLNNKGYLQSLTDTMAAIKSSRQGDSGMATVKRVLESRLASYVPSALDNFNADNTVRDVRGYLDAIMKKIPGMSEGLSPQFDNFGEPMIYPQGSPWRHINPFSLAQGKSGPARDEMNFWAEGPTATKFAMPHPSVDGRIDLRDYKNPYTGQNAYDRWMQLVASPIFNGKTTEQDMDQFVKSDAYKELKKSGKIDPVYSDHPAPAMLRTMLGNHYKQAYETMLNERGFEDLQGALGQFKANMKAIPRGATMPANPTIDQLLKAK